VTDDPASVGPVDIVFFTVKLYDTEAALASLPPLVGPATIVIPFQNGVDSVELLSRKLGKTHVAGGTTYVTAVVAEPGLIRHTAMERLIFGPVTGSAPLPSKRSAMPASARVRRDPERSHSRRYLDEVCASFGVQRHDGRHPQSDWCH
jgi:2-dehydropantoate 2-reductase